MSIPIPLPARSPKERGVISVRLVPAAQEALEACMRRDGDRITDILNRAVVLYHAVTQEMHDQVTGHIQIGDKVFQPEGVLEG